MTVRLKAELARIGLKHAPFAASIGLSRPALSAICNHGHFLPSLDRGAVETRIQIAIRRAGGNDAGLFTEEVTPSRSNATASIPSTTATPCPQENEMLLRKQTLSQATRKHFELARNPFEEAREVADVFLSPDIRYVREAMWEKARHGGFLAVIGESGSGKSTLREELEERLKAEDQPTIVIKPYVLAMEDNDRVGKTLKAQHIAEAIMSTVAPLAKTMSSPEARFKQLHTTLIDSRRAGHTHLLIIEEAHSLPIPTLKHLKRFIELKDGLRPLISVVLLGQSELAQKLNENDPGVREVVQRVEIVTLGPLNADLETYLKHRFERAGLPLARVFDAGAIEALRARLSPEDRRGVRAGSSLTYPLVVHNVLTAAMNASAELGLPRVTAEAVRGV